MIRALKGSGLCNAGGTAGCHNLAVIPVHSLLKAVDAREQHHSAELREAVIHESKLEPICEDHQMDGLVSIIEHTAPAPARPKRGGLS